MNKSEAVKILVCCEFDGGLPGERALLDEARLVASIGKLTRPTNYDEYLKSAHWKLTRDKALKRAGRRCQVCNSNKRPNVHHRTYERVGNEDEMDLTVLCERCHKMYHEIPA